MKEIKLSKGKVSIIDDDDFDRVSMFKWNAKQKIRGGQFVYYAVRSEYNYMGTGKRKRIPMSEFILGAVEGLIVDHIDGDGLNNQKSNLRYATHQQNCMNRKKMNGCACAYKGVYKSNKKFRSDIYFNNSKIQLGLFDTEQEAALAYNKAALKYFGEFAYLNVI